MKVVIVHDWLTDLGGAESVLQSFCNIFPDADIYTVVNFIDSDKLKFLSNHKIFTTFIQKLPFAKNGYRKYLPLMPYAIEQLDLSSYDLVLSSSYCVAKGVITGPNQVHLCYCHSPVRYAWDLQHQYLSESNLSSGIKSLIARYFLHKIRIWDVRSSFGVDYIIANSKFISKRIEKVYRRQSQVIYPPVNTDEFALEINKEDYFITCSRLVPYKRIDLIVESFKYHSDKSLIVIGDGPEMGKLKKLAGKNVTLMGYQPFEVLKSKVAKAKAFIFAAEEDFGIVPVEAQATGTPVIAFGKGGALETIIERKTGLFFHQQSVEAISKALNDFKDYEFDPVFINNHASRFSRQRFESEIKSAIKSAQEKHL